MKPWVTDAQFVDDNYRDLIFKNARIDAFLRGHEQFIIVASKGMGKTLLIRLKRDFVQRDNPSIILIPHNHTTDFVHLSGSLPASVLTSMKDRRFWEDIWKIAISISILLNFPHRLSEAEKASIEVDLKRIDLPASLDSALRDAFNTRFHEQRFPSSVLGLLLQEGKSRVEKIRSIAPQVIHDLLLRHVTSGCFVFIDSFDQALEKVFGDDLDAWCAAQCGLLKAAWEISRQNRHVKVHATIRQEAYASFSDAERTNIKGSVLLIEYSKDDLKNIFNKAIRHYEGAYTLEQFAGLEKMYNGYLRMHEDLFDYIYRHTIGVPRWLMIIGSALSASREERGVVTAKKRKLRQREIAEIINKTSAIELAHDYLRTEMKLFFRGDDADRFVSELVSRINSTVLSLGNLRRISERFLTSTNALTRHPFCLLYNFGLLGYAERNAASNSRTQVFKKPYEFDWSADGILPIDKSGRYLLHPALHYLIQRRNPHFNYNQVRIGDGLPWAKKDEETLERETLRIFISYAHSDSDMVEKIVLEIENRLNDKAITHEIWFDKWSMRAGAWVQDQISDGLGNSQFLILMVSANSLASGAVAAEWKVKFADKFRANDDSVFPLYLQGTEPRQAPEFLREIFGYSYRGEQDLPNVIRLADDILFWRNRER